MGVAVSAGPVAATHPVERPVEARVLYGCLSGPRTEEPRSGPNSGPIPLCSVKPDGTDRRVLTDRDTGYGADKDWSPDGRRFAYPDTSFGDGDGGLVVANADGSNRRVVAPGEYQGVEWSPDGTTLAATGSGDDGREGLWLVDLTDGTRRLLVEGFISRVSWSPDGSRLVFVDIDDTDPEAPRVPLAVVSTSTGRVRPLGVEATSTLTTWSPDGRWLLEGLRLISPEDGSVRMLRTVPPGTYYTGRWSPDGAQIALQANRDGRPPSIELVRSDGSDLRTLVTLERSQSFLPPAWLPDGSALVYERTRQDPDVEALSLDTDLFRIGLDGSPPVQITEGDSGHRPVLPPMVTRLAGPTRVDTAVSVSRASWSRATTVVLARADLFPDALSAAPLAGKHDAPLLLSAPDSASAAVLAEVRRLGATTAYLVGDATALSAQVEAQLRGAGVTTVRRIGGTTRYETSAALAREVGGQAAFLASGQDFPDAAAVSALAAHLQRPVLLTTRDVLPAATARVLDELGTTAVTVVGGPAAVSEPVAEQAGEGRDLDRLAGADRYATSAAVADASLPGAATHADLNADRPWLATGRAFPDALSAGPAAARDGRVLLLVDPRTLAASPATGAWLRRYASAYGDVVAVGGPDVVSPAVTTQALKP
jgi:hypothetical protein